MESEKKSPCKYGSTCYRKNTEHLEKFSHPETSKRSRSSSRSKEEISSKRAKTTVEELNFDLSEDTPILEITAEDDEDYTAAESDTQEESRVTDTPENMNIKDELKLKFKAEMPQDLFDFWEFCCSLNPREPTQALVPSLGLVLVGPFDIIDGKFRNFKFLDEKPCYVLHWRYYYDPPEFQTVMMKADSTQHHFGYYRDDPKELPAFVGENYANMNGVIRQQGDNLFAAVKLHMAKLLRSTKDEKAIVAIKKIDQALTEWAQVLGYSLAAESPKLKERNKKAVTKSFHGAGLVVPVHGDVGYRELPETDANLKKMFKRIAEATSDEERMAHFEPLQEIMTYVQFANDECDYGEGLELGLDMFTFGDSILHKAIMNVLPLAYALLDRPEFAEILELHLNDRRKTELNQLK